MLGLLNNKTYKLETIIKSAGKSVVAYSGGVDSSYLLYRANQVAPQNITAATIRTPYMSVHETDEAIDFTNKYGINHVIIEVPTPENIKFNPENRCYLCKKLLFEHLIKYASENGFDSVLDGTNADDLKEFRPGLQALKELKVISPLAEAGVTKEEIRKMAKKANLSFWAKPSMTCLLTRVPHKTKITDKMLRMIDSAEQILLEHGYPGVRVRVHDTLARIECLPGFIKKIVNDPQRDEIINDIKKVGFSFVTIDLEGYRISQ